MDEIKMKYENQIFYLSEYFILLNDDMNSFNYHIDFRKENKCEYISLVSNKTNYGWEEVRFDNTKGYPSKFIQNIGKLISNNEKNIQSNL